MIQNEMARLRANLAEINSPGTLFEDNSRNHPDNGNYNKSPVKVLVPEVVDQETQAANTETLVESLPLYGRTPMSSLKDLQKMTAEENEDSNTEKNGSRSPLVSNAVESLPLKSLLSNSQRKMRSQSQPNVSTTFKLTNQNMPDDKVSKPKTTENVVDKSREKKTRFSVVNGNGDNNVNGATYPLTFYPYRMIGRRSNK